MHEEDTEKLTAPASPDLRYFESGEAFRYIGQIKDKFQQAMEERRLGTAAKAVGFTGFYKIVQAYKKANSEQSMKIIDMDNVSAFDVQPFELNTKTWHADETGIWRYGRGEPVYACTHPIMPVRLLRGVDTRQMKVELYFRFSNNTKREWESIIVEMKDIASANNIVNRLSSVGISVTSGERANALVDYLRDMIDANRDVIPEVKSVSRMGWNEEGFSPYTSGLLFDGADRFRKVYNAISQVGSMDAWMAEALEARTYSLVARIVLAASFASVLVEPLGCLPFFVHLWGLESGSGKTVTQMLAAAVWANPTVGNPFFPTFKGTDVGFELLAGFLHSLPLFLDDLQLKKDSKGKVIFSVYDLASGAGKLRANKELGLNYTPEWKNCFITSGETPIVNETDGAGALNRVIEIECMADQNAIRDGHRTANVLKENYGWAGKVFIEKLSEDGAVDHAKALYDDFFKACMDNDTTSKQAMAAAVVLVADKLATDWIFHDGRALTVAEIGRFLKERSAVSLVARGYDILCDWISENVNKFQPEKEIGECYGMIETGADHNTAYINRTAFNRFCAENELPPKGLLSHLRSQNLIETGERGYTKTKRIRGVNTNCVWLRMENPQEELQNDDFDLPL